MLIDRRLEFGDFVNLIKSANSIDDSNQLAEMSHAGCPDLVHGKVPLATVVLLGIMLMQAHDCGFFYEAISIFEQQKSQFFWVGLSEIWR